MSGDGCATCTASAGIRPIRTAPSFRPLATVQGHTDGSSQRTMKKCVACGDAFRSTQMPDLWSEDPWRSSARARHLGRPRPRWHGRPCKRPRRSSAGAAVMTVQSPSLVRDIPGRYPGTSVLLTACRGRSLRWRMPDGSDICVVFSGPHRTMSETRFGRDSGPNAASNW